MRTDVADNCSCGRIAIGLTVTENRNWNPDCVEHGLRSAWYRSDEQVQRRAQQDAKLREMYRAAREARRNAAE